MIKEKPHYLNHRQRLRERFLKGGFEGLADHEQVEVVLTLAVPRSDVKPLAKRLLKQLKVLDHLRISAEAAFSFRKKGLL